MRSPTDTARALYAAIESGQHGASLTAFFTEDARTTEHPNLIKPKGAEVDLAAMLRASEAGAGLLARQRYEIRSIAEVGPMVVVRLTWSGVIARALGPFREGQLLRAHIAQFIETRGERIASIETYDCYEPFT